MKDINTEDATEAALKIRELCESEGFEPGDVMAGCSIFIASTIKGAQEQGGLTAKQARKYLDLIYRNMKTWHRAKPFIV